MDRDTLTIDRAELAGAASELWDAAHNGYALDGYSLQQVHEALWAAFQATLTELIEDLTWHATSGDDTTGLGRHLHDHLGRLVPDGPPLDEAPEPAGEDDTTPTSTPSTPSGVIGSGVEKESAIQVHQITLPLEPVYQRPLVSPHQEGHHHTAGKRGQRDAIQAGEAAIGELKRELNDELEDEEY